MAALLHAKEHVDRLKLGAQILDLALMFPLEPFQRSFELTLRRLDVLADDSYALLQVRSNIAHG